MPGNRRRNGKNGRKRSHSTMATSGVQQDEASSVSSRDPSAPSTNAEPEPSTSKSPSQPASSPNPDPASTSASSSEHGRSASGSEQATSPREDSDSDEDGPSGLVWVQEGDLNRLFSQMCCFKCRRKSLSFRFGATHGLAADMILTCEYCGELKRTPSLKPESFYMS